MDNGPTSRVMRAGDLYVGSPVFARPSRAALHEFITPEEPDGAGKAADGDGEDGSSSSSSSGGGGGGVKGGPESYYGRWLAGTVIGIGCHPALRRPWDQGRYQVKFSFEPMLCYVTARNIIKRAADDVVEGEWVPPAVGDVVFADDPDSDNACVCGCLLHLYTQRRWRRCGPVHLRLLIEPRALLQRRWVLAGSSILCPRHPWRISLRDDGDLDVCAGTRRACWTSTRATASA
jgi:hypothetical protein